MLSNVTGAIFNLICTDKDEKIMQEIEKYFNHQTSTVMLWLFILCLFHIGLSYAMSWWEEVLGLSRIVDGGLHNKLENPNVSVMDLTISLL